MLKKTVKAKKRIWLCFDFFWTNHLFNDNTIRDDLDSKSSLMKFSPFIASSCITLSKKQFSLLKYKRKRQIDFYSIETTQIQIQCTLSFFFKRTGLYQITGQLNNTTSWIFFSDNKVLFLLGRTLDFWGDKLWRHYHCSPCPRHVLNNFSWDELTENKFINISYGKN